MCQLNVKNTLLKKDTKLENTQTNFKNVCYAGKTKHLSIHIEFIDH